MNYPTYLVHFNKNHDPKSGRFAPGDGNGDGVVGKRNEQMTPEQKKRRTNAIVGTAAAATVTAGLAAMMIADAVNSRRTAKGKSFADNYDRLSISEAADWARRMGGLSIE